MIVTTINKLKKYYSKEIEADNSNMEKERMEILCSSVNNLEDIINKEYEINIKNIEDDENSSYSKENRDRLKQRYEMIIESLK